MAIQETRLDENLTDMTADEGMDQGKDWAVQNQSQSKRVYIYIGVIASKAEPKLILNPNEILRIRANAGDNIRMYADGPMSIAWDEAI